MEKENDTSGKLDVETSQHEADSTQPVVCLGKTFPNDTARREHYIEKLREHLHDPKFRELEGFPLGSDEAILNLSDPPYYTVCPNPWLAEFVKAWEQEKPETPEAEQVPYHREPFAADVSEGKADPIYYAHAYHTKVPHRAVMRYILHYTEPGDIVYDGFCGTGMTGVAAQMCGDRDAVMSLGYQVKPDGTILQGETDTGGTTSWRPFSKLGVRKAVLSELSSAASFIAYTYNAPIDVAAFQQEADRILKEVEAEYGWMYETLHTDGETRCQIHHIVWSDVFICPDCANELVFWEVAVDKQKGVVKDEFPCPECAALLTKKRMERARESYFDTAINETVRQSKQVPVWIRYIHHGKRLDKRPDDTDFELINKIRDTESPYWFPTTPIPKGDTTRPPLKAGMTNAHHFYTKRILITLAAFKAKIHASSRRYLSWFTSFLSFTGREMRLKSLENYFKGNSGGIIARLSGVLYIPSLSVEVNVIERLAFRTKRLGFQQKFRDGHVVTACVSATHVAPAENSIDYIFLDPPFGANLHYSELNFFMESWLGVLTDNTEEAVESKSQGKSGPEYRQLMNRCFREAYRILKPGHWMTVEFSNTKAVVWNNIQTALTGAGFIVANVASLDKQVGTFNSVTTSTAVKQDLVISAYKPNGGFQERFLKDAQTEERVWDFVRTHLGYLAVIKKKDNLLQIIPERDPRLLFDQMVAYYVRQMHFVPVSSQEFQLGLTQRFMERDGMFFLPAQGAEYDRQKLISGGVQQRDLFVFDEASAIDWLRHLLRKKPQRFSDLNPQFMQVLGGWRKSEVSLDLSELLSQNFLCYDGKGAVPEQIHIYLANNWKEFRQRAETDPELIKKAHERWYVPNPNKASDLEQLRERTLLKEFDVYKAEKKKLKVFRAEAVRAGFKKAWQGRDYATIIAVAGKIPPSVLEEDAKLIMWYDQALTRTETAS